MNVLDGLCAPIERGNREKFVCEAEDVIFFKFCECEADVQAPDDTAATFKPEFTHQVFGDQEVIFGYKGLKINIYYTVGSLKQYVKVQHSETVPVNSTVEPDNVLHLISEQTPAGFTTNYNEFIMDMNKDKSFRPPGDLITSYKQDEKTFEIFHATFANPKFQDYHSRLQTFIIWYIDAASYIDDEDHNWNLYTLFERVTSCGETRYKSIGFLSCYNYYCYPNKKRPRISQVLVLPPYQKCGHGAKLLTAMYEHSCADPLVCDITVEDPSENFTRLRNFVDALKCSSLPSFQPDKLKDGFSEEMVAEAGVKYKITAVQVRKIYELLRLRATDVSKAEEYKKYRLEVKRRLNIPFQKEKKSLQKLEKFLQPQEYEAVLQSKSVDNQHEFLEKSYRDVELEYRKVIERLSAHVEV
ncbi:histone acetyltransferase type B catalytic subunit-like [Bolinopsis microptera]|uniref:histone acetyltransferase type B catalytic subunit-like n=1 Tax=Bolinopsis microptera TaxID=2820187 RepID=UPI00307A2837